MKSNNQQILQGIIKSWDQERGFGFAKRADGQGDVFVHVNNLPNRGELAIGTEIEFDIDRDPKTGRRMAANVRITRLSLSRGEALRYDF
jgi:cold shock CspA family protein